MPFIIETRKTGRRPADNPLGMWSAMARQGSLRDDLVSRLAVATLEEARDATYNECVLAWHRRDLSHEIDRLMGEIRALPESGGTIGPLPDGTIIEVMPATWTRLYELARLGIRSQVTDADFFDAINRRLHDATTS
jgi:hypothetical protein